MKRVFSLEKLKSRVADGVISQGALSSALEDGWPQKYDGAVATKDGNWMEKDGDNHICDINWTIEVPTTLWERIKAFFAK